MAVYYFSGNENYLKKQELKKIIKNENVLDCNVEDFYEHCQDIYDFMFSVPFVGNKKIGIIHFVPDQEELVSAMKDIPDFTDLYVVTNDFLDQRKRVIKEFKTLATEKKFEKINELLLYKSISSRLQRFGYKVEEIEAHKDVLMECFNSYIVSLDMDLDTVIIHVDMIGHSGELTPENIRAFAPESSNYKAFQLSNLLLSRNEKCIDFGCKLLEQGDNPILILSTVAYQFRVCYKATLFSDENYLSLIGIRNYQLYENFKAYSAEKYKNIYGLLMDGIRKIKKGENASAVLITCLNEALVILKEEL